MENKNRRFVCFLIGFAVLLFVTSIPANAAAREADCNAGLIKCLFAYGIAFGPAMALTLCLAGYAWCLQFLN